MKKALLLLIILTGFHFTYAENAEDSKQSKSEAENLVSIHGKILDKNTGEELVCALIKVEGTEKTVYTDAEGRYSINNLEPGKYNLKVSYISYKETELRDVEITSRADARLNVELESL